MTNKYIDNIIKTFGKFSYKYDRYDVFNDFLYMAAAAFSNAVDKVNFKVREAEYLKRINKYNKDEQQLFPQILGDLVMCFEAYGPDDYLGRIFMGLELGNKDRGQFFTPYTVSKLMAQMTLNKDEIDKHIAEKGYITMYEPTVGAGGMVIAMYDALYEMGYNPQQVLRVTSQDVDIRGVLMTYIQSAILNIDNTVILGNSLTLECREVWRTPSRFIRLVSNLNNASEEPKPMSEVTQMDLFEVEDFTEFNVEGQLVLSI